MVVGMKRIKQYGIWLRLLMKRLLKQPVFIGLLLLIAVMGYAVSTLEQGGSSGAVVAVCVEESRWSEQPSETGETDPWESCLSLFSDQTVSSLRHGVSVLLNFMDQKNFELDFGS